MRITDDYPGLPTDVEVGLSAGGTHVWIECTQRPEGQDIIETQASLRPEQAVRVAEALLMYARRARS